MAEFCSCGSIVLNGRCTNKNCDIKPAGSSKQVTPKSTAVKPRSGKADSEKNNQPKDKRIRRASKCIVYNLYDNNKEEDVQ